MTLLRNRLDGIGQPVDDHLANLAPLPGESATQSTEQHRYRDGKTDVLNRGLTG